MNGLDDIIAELRRLHPHFQQKYGVSRLWIFGSRARGSEKPDSDLDVLVEFSKRGFSLYDFASLNLEMEDALGLRVELVERDALRSELKATVFPEAVAV